jgi:apolipoprotein N-acyltransferase
MKPFFAAEALEKVQRIPFEFWWKAALAIAIFVGVIIALRKLANMNKVVLSVIVFVVVMIIGFNWVYQRNEPAFMTPFVEKVAPFFPSKGTRPGY